ncbi:hypothetical protein [Bradyrhizobium sp. RT9a]|uniref:hypothetical protein n=1 Tax=Bradyrhizobium sp. RT9a TaxID=3156384 RepID=UPI0033972157
MDDDFFELLADSSDAERVVEGASRPTLSERPDRISFDGRTPDLRRRCGSQPRLGRLAGAGYTFVAQGSDRNHQDHLWSPGDKDRGGFRIIIVAASNADPYPEQDTAIAALGAHFGLTLDRHRCFPYGG